MKKASQVRLITTRAAAHKVAQSVFLGNAKSLAEARQVYIDKLDGNLEGTLPNETASVIFGNKTIAAARG